MKALPLSLAIIALLAPFQCVLGQKHGPVEGREGRERMAAPPHQTDVASGPQYRDDVPKWVPIVILLIMGASIAAVAIAFQEVNNKLKWAVGSVIFLTVVVGLVYLVFFVILGIPHN